MVKEIAGKVSKEKMGPATLVSNADRAFAVVMFTLWHQEFFNEIV